MIIITTTVLDHCFMSWEDRYTYKRKLVSICTHWSFSHQNLYHMCKFCKRLHARDVASPIQSNEVKIFVILFIAK